MTLLDELMRRCREDGHTPLYQDLVKLHAEVTDLEKDRDYCEVQWNKAMASVKTSETKEPA